MNKYTLFAVLFWPLILLGSDIEWSWIKTETLPTLGQKLENLPESRTLILANSATLIPSYKVSIDSIEYTIGVRKPDSTVAFIATSSDKAMTQEGLHVGSTAKELAALNLRFGYDPGWGRFALLPSGWGACFPFDEDITDDSKILFFFRRLREHGTNSSRDGVAGSDFDPLVLRPASGE